MAYIAGLVITGIFFLTLHYFTELTKKQKLLVSVIILSIILSAIGFNKYKNIQRENMLNIVMKFNQGQSIKCDGVIIDSKNYSLSIGTYTFIGKEGTQNYSKMISVSTCRD